MKSLLKMYGFGFATTLTYMLQSVEYRPGPYLRWFWRTQDFSAVMYRRSLELTKPARALRFVLSTGMFVQFSFGVALVVQWAWQAYPAGWQLGLALLVSYPVVWAHLITIPLVMGRMVVVVPRQRAAIRTASKIYAAHPGIKVAVIGSYGKTTMKELLLTVLSEGKKVAATPANHNVAVSHARFASQLDGDEDILILEYGEGRPGDIGRFASATSPTHAVITGLAPAHLDQYKTIGRAAADLFSIAQYVDPDHVLVNRDGRDMKPFLKKDMKKFGKDGCFGWKTKAVKVDADGSGMSFTMTKGKRRLHLRSGLIGKHMVGPLAFVAAFGLECGLTEAQVTEGISKTRPFEHRMQPVRVSGALLIDDTYNGNLEGVRAGTALLAALSAQRKWYVTPGLVEQGRDSAKIHHAIGELVASAKPDIVVLMDNSVRPYIEAGLAVGGYEGELRIEQDPVAFYTSLPHRIAAGDVVMMQNDWTDNYQ